MVLDVTIVNIALPQIQQALGFSTTSLSWVLNAYTLTFGGLLLLGGRAGDILGRRRTFIAGILVFTLASFLGGLATTSGLLLAARPAGCRGRHRRAHRAVVDHHQLRRGHRAQPRLRGVLGGGRRRGRHRPDRRRHPHLVACRRWVLFVNVPIGVVLASLAPLYITESERQPGTFDLGGALTSTAE